MQVRNALADASPTPISSLLIKPASALCNLRCSYCFYLDRPTDPYAGDATRVMDDSTLRTLIRRFMQYARPQAVFAWQGGEPTLAGADFFERVCLYQRRYGAPGQVVSNALQTNATLLGERWCDLLSAFDFLVGVSLDGPEPVHDRYRRNKGGEGSWRKTMNGLDLLRRRGIAFNVLCVVSQANVGRAKEVYRFYRRLGVDHIQYIPLAETNPDGSPRPWSISPNEYGRFMLQTFRLWWPNRRKVRIRLFDNIAEALAGLQPGNCTMCEKCDSYVVIEHNGDVYPCDFFVREEWKLGNVREDSFDRIALHPRRSVFADKKRLPHPECAQCPYLTIGRGGCPMLREKLRGDFADLDYFCAAYRTVLKTVVPPLRVEVRKILSSDRGRV